MKLFEDKLRDNYKRASSGEDAYSYYDNNQQDKIVEVRELLNKWFENYPEENKLELQQSFKNSFYNAFYELFIHETFYCQGYTLQVHPLLENSSKSTTCHFINRISVFSLGMERLEKLKGKLESKYF